MGKRTQSNKDINMMLEIQHMKLFLTQNIYASTLGRVVVNEKLKVSVKKFYCSLFVFFLVFNFFYLLSCLLFALF